MLELKTCTVATEKMPSFFTGRDACFSNLKRLSIDGDSNLGFGLELIRNCPRLGTLEGKALVIDEYFDDLTSEGLGGFLRSQSQSRLQSLTLSELNDNQAAIILDACSPLKEICFPSSTIWCRFLVSLEQRFETVEHLDVEDCERLYSWMLQRILTSCPKLITFASSKLYAFEFVKGQSANETNITGLHRRK